MAVGLCYPGCHSGASLWPWEVILILGELMLISGEITFVWGWGSLSSRPALRRLLCHVVVLLCPFLGGPLGFFVGGTRSCAELPHKLSLSSAPKSPRVARITLQLPDLLANACMYVSPGSPHTPSPSLPVPLPGVPDWDPTCEWGCLWLHQGCL